MALALPPSFDLRAMRRSTIVSSAALPNLGTGASVYRRTHHTDKNSVSGNRGAVIAGACRCSAVVLLCFCKVPTRLREFA